jgi:hypothetical protein
MTADTEVTAVPAGDGRIPQGPPWEELVTAALLGAERRPLPGGSAGALLDLAAVHTVRTRAGLVPDQAGERPEPAADDPRPPLPPAAAERFAQLIGAARRPQYDGVFGEVLEDSPADLGALLPEWLELANAHGYRPSPGQLPALLTAARARTDLRPAALAFAGPRGRWLARLNPEWKFVLRASPAPGVAVDEALADDPAAVRRLWEEGLLTERVTVLAVLRRRSADEGRELLAGSWATERPEDRLMFADTLREALCAADEPFLEQVLRDRSKMVRATAAELLSLLPGSALAGRMARRARSCVALDPAGGGPGRLAVEPPYECDAAMKRDGVVAKPPVGHGERSWWLTQVVEATPLAAWSGLLQGRSAAEIVALPVADDWRADLHVAWSRAAVRQRDAGWARALLGSPDAPVAQTAERAAKLLSMLPAGERAAWAAGFVAAQGVADAYRVLSGCEGPWPPVLSEAVVAGLREAAGATKAFPSNYRSVLSLAACALDPAEADRLLPLAVTPAPSELRGTGRALYWAQAFQRLTTALRLRATMMAELAPGLSGPSGPSPAS